MRQLLQSGLSSLAQIDQKWMKRRDRDSQWAAQRDYSTEERESRELDDKGKNGIE